MATIVANFTTGFDMSKFDLSFMPAMTLTDIRTTNLGWSSSTDPYALSFYGHDFAVVESGSQVFSVTAGTIFSVGLDYANGILRFAGNFNAVHVFNSLEAQDLSSFLHQMLVHSDQMSGGSFNDLLFSAGGNDSLNGFGGNDTLRGDGGSDTLVGGAGNDRLIGGSGHDYFLFDTKPGVGNVDRIVDFTPGIDHIGLSKSVFTVFGGTGNIDPLAFHEGRVATSVHTHLIYNPFTGNLLYDADGKGGDPAVQIAHLQTGLTLTDADFWVFL